MTVQITFIMNFIIIYANYFILLVFSFHSGFFVDSVILG